MDRRNFCKTTTLLGGATLLVGSYAMATSKIIDAGTSTDDRLWFDRSRRWAQLAFVENDPGNYDPDFWLNYFKNIHSDGVLLSAGGVVAFYPTEIPLHHRSAWM